MKLTSTAGRHTVKGDPSTNEEVVGGIKGAKQERNRLWLVVMAMGAGLVGAGVVLATLANTHQFIPVMALLDTNGHVMYQKVVDKEALTANESFVQSDVYQFIQACNSFDPAWRQYYADRCHLRASQEVSDQFDKEISGDGASNPYYGLPTGGYRRPEVTGIQKLDANTYQVQFRSVLELPVQGKPLDRDAAAAVAARNTQYFTALIRFRYTNKPLAVGDRWENPLGFVVTSYRKDQELSRK